VLVRALARAAEEVGGHQEGDRKHHDGQENLSMHRNSHQFNGRNHRDSRNWHGDPSTVIWLYEAHGMPGSTLALSGSIYAESDLPEKYSPL
jgi:hypothetical protein